MESVWRAECTIDQRPALQDNIKADVAVVGAGMAGILTAYLLKEQGADVVILEAGRTAGGVTADTTAKITSQHGLIYRRLTDEVGFEQAKQYADANEKAIKKYRQLVLQKEIDCGFEELPSYVYSTDKVASLEEEVEAAQKLGLKASFANELPLPFSTVGAVKFSGQAQFQPLKFVKEIAKDLTIYENTPVTQVSEQMVRAGKYTVQAKKVVVATHFPILNTPGYYFMRMYQQRSYVLALEGAAQLDGMFIDMDEQGYSFRNYKNLLLLGGGGHRCGKGKGDSYWKLEKAAREFYPSAAERYRWSAQDCMTLDGIPYIGCYSESTPSLFVATGFNKWGMTGSMTAAMILNDLIAGRKNPNAEVFSPQRFHLAASAQTIMDDAAALVSSFSKRVFHFPKERAEELKNGEGKVVDLDGEKVGVYKDEDGNLHTVSANCPHMGCELSFNAEEKTWECPCHGSLFDCNGMLLNNPAGEGISS
ncbi:FAD-dependent oxidoreductase [Candidatus Soleaferrea massiliensis]|uniref:FAD-dependent oxidoreductase n=1 Tax=Candidatus Soleaferrea massiliensis TaxID=1470354 RepID=UPI00058E67EF|nr:FAD-dependent oxidoreductase [Candidatus Soleaferrea massiliensis]